jgi:hypothetical protein
MLLFRNKNYEFGPGNNYKKGFVGLKKYQFENFESTTQIIGPDN